MTSTRKPSRDPQKPSLRTDERGAVLVEFLVALMPLMITFSSFVQLSQIATARVVVKHATIVGARAAAVISNANHNTPDQKSGDNLGEIRNGVWAALGPWSKTMRGVDVEVQDQSSCDDPYGLVTVTVNARYKCSVPFGGQLLCGTHGGMHDISFKVGFPHEGARYKEGGGAQCQ